MQSPLLAVTLDEDYDPLRCPLLAVPLEEDSLPLPFPFLTITLDEHYDSLDCLSLPIPYVYYLHPSARPLSASPPDDQYVHAHAY